jgi:hypothetical protein
MTAEVMLTQAIKEALEELNRRPWMPHMTNKQAKRLTKDVLAWLERKDS